MIGEETLNRLERAAKDVPIAFYVKTKLTPSQVVDIVKELRFYRELQCDYCGSSLFEESSDEPCLMHRDCVE